MTDQSSTIPGWDELINSWRTLPDRILAKLPEARRGDPQFQQEAARLALESIASCSLDAIGGDANFPAFLPTIGQLLNVGQPNADTIYRSARISADGSYRIRGKRGSLNQTILVQVLPHNSEMPRPQLNVNALKVDKDGHYDVLLSPERPADYQGDWWPLLPAASMLLLRMVSSDWGSEGAPTFVIERLDKPMGRSRSTAQDLEQRLRILPRMTDTMGLLFPDHVEQLRQQGFVHKFKAVDMSQIGGLGGQFYYEAVFELADDEALVIESVIPDHCPYRSVILTNEIYETIDWINNHSCLNGDQAAADSDGKLRFVISPCDPGIKNWLDTAGHATGVIQGRWTDCDSQPIPSIQKIKLADIPNHFPSDVAMVTPPQRDQIIRERRAAYLQRPFW